MNIRDLSIFNENIKPSVLFRSGEISSIDELQILRAQKINNIFDFRCEYEIKLNEYSKILPKDISYFNIPIDTHLAEDLYQGTPMESVYQYFAYNCKEIFAAILKKIINTNGSILLSCRFGMDRTGVIIAILHLICGTPKEKIKEDYLRSGEIVVEKHLDIFLNIVSQSHSIATYFTGYLSSFEIQQLKLKILRP